MVRFSLIVPVYNLGAYLPDMLETVAAQTADLELWLVDDGSIDDSPKVAQQFVNGIPDWHALTLPAHAGVSAARNAGLVRASGEFVAFIDGDDLLAPDFVATLSAGFSAPDIVATAVGYHWWRTVPAGRPGWQILSQAEMFAQVAHHGSAIGGYVWNKAFRRAVIGSLRFDEHLRIAEDYWFTSAFVAANAGRYAYNAPVRYTKVARPGSTIYSANAAARRQEEQVFAQIRGLEEGLQAGDDHHGHHQGRQ